MFSPVLLHQARIASRQTALRSLLQARALHPRCVPAIPRRASPAYRHFSNSISRRDLAPTAASTSTSTTSTQSNSDEDVYNKVYLGPLDSTFRRLKIFSLGSLTLSTTLAPFMFVIESNLPLNARLALASIAITTSAVSTGLVSWCGKPYVKELRYIRPEENGGSEGMEIVTASLLLKPRITRVYDPSFLVETRRAFAKWQLAEKVLLPEGSREVAPGQEETIAETKDKNGTPLGRWIVTWGENGEGTCREVGHVVRYFTVHEELLP